MEPTSWLNRTPQSRPPMSRRASHVRGSLLLIVAGRLVRGSESGAPSIVDGSLNTVPVSVVLCVMFSVILPEYRLSVSSSGNLVALLTDEEEARRETVWFPRSTRSYARKNQIRSFHM